MNERDLLSQARRVVVKVGTRVLVDRAGRPDPTRMSALVTQLAGLRQQGRDVVLVSSGAIGAGMEALGLSDRPNDLPALQMAAAVGQSRLMARYAELFGQQACLVGQVLLTHEDLRNRLRHLNARNTMMALFRRGVVPIVNENDVVSVDEIRFSDNDHLAALVALLVDADLLILLTTTDGVRIPEKRPTGKKGGVAGHNASKRVAFLSAVTDETLSWVWDDVGGLSVGGMRLKLEAAKTAVHGGAAGVIADGRQPDVLLRIMTGQDVGTLIGRAVPGRRTMRSKKRWIAFFHRSTGAVVVDSGAKDALCLRNKSLLPIGIRQVEGHFEVGALVDVKDEQGRVIARGLVDYASGDLLKIMGRPSREIAARLGAKPYDEVIHRDNIVILAEEKR